MKLTPYEMETIILYNQEEAVANVYTHDPKLIAKLRRLQEKYPDRVFSDRPAQEGAVSYTVPKSCVSIREPYSDARRKADSERAKTRDGRHPEEQPAPSRSKEGLCQKSRRIRND